MGVDGLLKLIKVHSPGAITEVTYDQFKGQKWAIDASIFFYKFCHDPKQKKTNKNPHVDGFYKLFYRLYKHGIQPIIVFDGHTPDAKLHTVKQRSAQKKTKEAIVEVLQEELIALMGVSNDKPDMPTLLRRVATFKGHPQEASIQAKLEQIQVAGKNIINFQPGCYQDVIDLCDLMKVPTYRAHGEADALCTKLCVDGLADAVMSEDSDILLYKGRKLMCKVGWGDDLQCIDLDLILSGMGITYLQFVDLCILCGTDYTVETIGGLGPVGAYEQIKQGQTIEDILTGIALWQSMRDPQYVMFSKFTLPSDPQNFDYQAARDLILKAHDLEHTVIVPASGRILDIDSQKLSEMMMTKCRCRATTIPNHYQNMVQAIPLFNPDPTPPKIKVVLKTPLQLKLTLKPKVTMRIPPDQGV